MRRMIRRIGTSLFVVWFVLTLTFLIHHALPSDPARAMAGLQARPADVAELRIQLGLDQPLWKQYSRYMGRLVRGDLGQSYQRHTAVATILKERAFNTLMLALAATTLQVFFGTLAGMSVAFRRFRWIDHSVVFFTLVGISIPTFLSGLILQYWLAYRWRRNAHRATTFAHPPCTHARISGSCFLCAVRSRRGAWHPPRRLHEDS